MGWSRGNQLAPSNFAAPTDVLEVGQEASEGTATTALRSDARLAFPEPATAPQPVGAAAAIGAATTPARSDHTHIGATPAQITALQTEVDTVEADLNAAVIGAGNVPTGGTTGEILRKIDATSFNTEWAAPLPNFNVLDFGAVGNGVAVDTAALQAAIDAAEVAGGTVYLPSGVYRVSAALVIGASDVSLVGAPGATIRPTDASTQDYVVTATGMTNIAVIGLDIDVNGTARSAVLPQHASGLHLTSCTDCRIDGVTVRNTLGNPAGDGSAVCIGISTCERVTVSNCWFLDAGVAGTDASDGVYANGNGIIITGCVAEAVTDTAYVLENCNDSIVVGCVAYGSSRLASISTFGGANYVNNTIADCVFRSSGSAATTGAVSIQRLAAAGTLTNNRVANCTLANTAAGGFDAGIYILDSAGGGGIVNTVVTGCVIASAGTHGVYVSGAVGTIVTGCVIRESRSTSGIFLLNSSDAAVVIGNYLLNQQYGVAAENCTDVSLIANRIDGASVVGSWGIYFFGTVTPAVVLGNLIDNVGVGRIGHDAGTTLAIPGFYGGANGGAAVPKPDVAGSRGGNAALDSLLVALASLGLITNSTTA